MSEVVALRRSAKLLWTPSGGEVLPIHRLQDLQAHLSAWRDYGQVAMVHGQSAAGREARVTALGDDGWLVKVRDEGMVRGGWPCSKTLARLLEDGRLPGLFGDSPWYVPDDSTDLAGSVFISEQIQFNPLPIAQAVWAWLTAATMPTGYAAGKAGYDHVVFASVAEAIDWIANSNEQPWPADAAQATSDLAAELQVDRVVVTSPGQITLRLPETGRRVRVQFRGRSQDAQVRVIGMIDELGREYTMNLPNREVLRVGRKRSSRTIA